ncbi:N/A [soil metagenome]
MAIYMKLGNVPGTATSKDYPQWIVLHSIHWGLHVAVKTTVGAGGSRLSAGKITPSDVSIVKEFDVASLNLMKLAFAGKNVPLCVIAVTQEATDVGQTYLQYTLHDVIISSFQVSATDTGKPIDNITLNFSKIEAKASPTDERGNPINTVGGYDFAKALPF